MFIGECRFDEPPTQKAFHRCGCGPGDLSRSSMASGMCDRRYVCGLRFFARREADHREGWDCSTVRDQMSLQSAGLGGIRRAAPFGDEHFRWEARVAPPGPDSTATWADVDSRLERARCSGAMWPQRGYMLLGLAGNIWQSSLCVCGAFRRSHASCGCFRPLCCNCQSEANSRPASSQRPRPLHVQPSLQVPNVRCIGGRG